MFDMNNPIQVPKALWDVVYPDDSRSVLARDVEHARMLAHYDPNYNYALQFQSI